MKIELDYSDMKRIVIEAILLVCFGISVGLMFNYELVKNAFEGQVVATPSVESGSQVEQFPVPVALSDVEEMLARAVIVDARIPELYAEGHLPGAVSLPFAEAETRLEPFRASYQEKSLIIYCSGYGCSDSFDLAVLLLDNGFHDVMVYEGGFPEWRDAGLEIEEGAP